MTRTTQLALVFAAVGIPIGVALARSPIGQAAAELLWMPAEVPERHIAEDTVSFLTPRMNGANS